MRLAVSVLFFCDNAGVSVSECFFVCVIPFCYHCRGLAAKPCKYSSRNVAFLPKFGNSFKNMLNMYHEQDTHVTEQRVSLSLVQTVPCVGSCSLSSQKSLCRVCVCACVCVRVRCSHRCKSALFFFFFVCLSLCISSVPTKDVHVGSCTFYPTLCSHIKMVVDASSPPQRRS